MFRHSLLHIVASGDLVRLRGTFAALNAAKPELMGAFGAMIDHTIPGRAHDHPLEPLDRRER